MRALLRQLLLVLLLLRAVLPPLLLSPLQVIPLIVPTTPSLPLSYLTVTLSPKQ